MQTDNRDEMRERILEAALKRFSHYSAYKTTMNEIADDLHCSKASLYYYFPDKHAMHIAVLEKVAEIYFDELEKEAARAATAAGALRSLVNTRHDFVKRFCRLELFKVLLDKQMNTNETLQAVKQRETNIITDIITRGVQSGELESEDPAKVAALYIHAMIGLRLSVLAQYNFTDDIDEEGFETVRGWQIELADIFIKGLKK